MGTENESAVLFAIHTLSVRELCKGFYANDIIDKWFDGRSDNFYQESLRRGNIFVAELEGTIVGFVEFRVGVIENVFVVPEFVGRGFGRLLVNHALPHAKKSRSGRVEIQATLNAVPFYLNLGFLETGRGVWVGPDKSVQIPVVYMCHDGNL